MDSLTHALLTRQLIGKRPAVLMASIAPDVPFYLTYPPWVVAQGKLVKALTTNQWPTPPKWMQTLHYAFHSLPVAIVGGAVFRSWAGRWPRQELAAWVFHVAVDIPTHARKPWGPRFLWPFSDLAVDGVQWTEVVFRVLRRITG